MKQRRVSITAFRIVVVIAVCLIAALAALMLTAMKPAPLMFLAQTKLLLSPAPNEQGRALSSQDIELQTRNLAVLAGSHNTLIASAREIQAMGTSSLPEDLLRTVKITPLADWPGILTVEVQSPSAKEAKNAADILTRQTLTAHREHMGDSATEVTVVDETLVRPVDNHRSERMRLPTMVLAFGIVFVFGVGIGTLLRKR